MKSLRLLFTHFTKKNIFLTLIISSPIWISIWINPFINLTAKRLAGLYAALGVALLTWSVPWFPNVKERSKLPAILNPIWLILTGVLLFIYVYPELLYRKFALLGLFFIASVISLQKGPIIFLYIYPLINWLPLSFSFLNANSLWLILSSLFVFFTYKPETSSNIYKKFSFLWLSLFIFALGGGIVCISNLYRGTNLNLWLIYIDICILPFLALYLRLKIVQNRQQVFKLLLFIVLVVSSVLILPKFLPYKLILEEIPRVALQSPRLAAVGAYKFFGYNLYLTATFIAYYISTLVLIPFAIFISDQDNRWLKIISIIIGLFSSGVLINSGGRMGIVSVVLGSIVILLVGQYFRILKMRYVLILFLVLMLASYVTLNTGLIGAEILDRYIDLAHYAQLRHYDINIYERIDSWQEGLQEVMEHPMGRGFSPFLEASGRAMHNDYIFVFLGAGLIGFIGFMMFIIGMYFKTFLMLLSKSKNVKICGLIILGVLISFCANAVTDHLIHYCWPFNSIILVFGAALAAGINEERL